MLVVCRVVKGVSGACVCSVRVWQCRRFFRFFFRNRRSRVTTSETPEREFSLGQKLPRQADVEKTRRAPARLRVASLSRARSRAFLARFTFSRLAFPRAHALVRHAPPLHKEAFPPPAVSSPKKRTNRRPPREIRPRREEDPAVSRCPPCFATCSPAWRGPTQRRGWCTTTPSGTSRSWAARRRRTITGTASGKRTGAPPSSAPRRSAKPRAWCARPRRAPPSPPAK